MSKLLFFGLFISFSASANQPIPAGKLSCEAWVQRAGQATPERLPLSRTELNTFGDETFAGRLAGFDFKAIHRAGMTTIEMSVEKNNLSLAAASTRVPSENNSSTYLDVAAPGNLELRLQCEVEDFDWE